MLALMSIFGKVTIPSPGTCFVPLLYIKVNFAYLLIMKSQNLSWYLKNVDLFQGLSAEALKEVSRIVHEKICPKKELLYSPHSEMPQIYILKKGEITLYLSREGKRYILDILGPGSIFGQITPEQKEPDHFAEVTQEAYVCLVSLENFSVLIAKYPEILMNLMRIMAEQVQDYQKKLSHNLMSAEEKVVFCLEENKNKNTGLLAKWFNKERKMTHARIAEKTGLSRETVSRILSRFKKEGKL